MIFALRTPAWVAGLVLIFAASQGIAASSEKPASFPQILSYEQLMSLPKYKQIQYIKGIREILVELATTPGGRMVSQNEGRPGDNFRSPAASNNASVVIQEASPPAAASSAAAPASTAAQAEAPTDGTGPATTGDPSAQAAAAPNPTETSSTNATSPPVSGQLPVMSDANVNNLTIGQIIPRIPSQGSDDVQCDTRRNIILFTHPADKNIRGCRLGSATYKQSCDLRTFVPVVQQKTGSFFCMTKASFNALSEEDRKKLQVPNPEAPANTTASTFFKQHAQPSSSPPTQNASPADTGTTASSPEANCKAPSLNCQNLDLNEARQRFYQDSQAPNLCVYAGNISHYVNEKVQYGCIRVSEFHVSSDHTLRCDNNKREAICNPLLFGVNTDGNPICLGPPHRQITNRCNQLSEATVERAQTFLTEQKSGIQESWNELQQKLGALCYKSQSALDFHCTECKIMVKRLAQLNTSVTGKCWDVSTASTGSPTQEQLPPPPSSSSEPSP